MSAEMVCKPLLLCTNNVQSIQKLLDFDSLVSTISHLSKHIYSIILFLYLIIATIIVLANLLSPQGAIRIW